MAKNRFYPSKQGQIDLRNSPEVQKMLLKVAENVKHKAESFTGGLSYTTDVQPGENRAHARVTTANEKAYWVQVRTKNLSSALDAG